MSIRNYMILSYIALILMIMLGFWVVDDILLDNLEDRNLSISQAAIKELTDANIRLSEQVLSTYGQKIVETKVEHAAKELSYLLRQEKRYDYKKLRRNQTLRQIATQPVETPEGQAGYLILYDRQATNIFHPDKQVEGQNYRIWQETYPEMWALVNRSFQEDQVSGHLTFFDRQKKERRRFTVIRRVAGTPFYVAAVVNMDEFFLPAQAKISQASQELQAKAQISIKASADRMDSDIRLAGLVEGVIFSLIGCLMGWWFASAISRPLRRLEHGVEQVGEGNFAVAVPPRGAKEIVHLAQSFNHLGEKLTEYIEKRDFIRDTFGRYVTQEVVKKLLESHEALELGGETREVSMLMCDLRGFTALTADMEPEQVITFLNRYLGKMIEVLVEHRAVIDEIIGDGILAFFGAPTPQENHPRQAVACALKMQLALEDINRQNEAEGFLRLEMGIAVNTGKVVVGNIGSELRTKYSVVGSPVNFTGRMESFSVGGQVLISESTWRQVRNEVLVGDILEVQMKGVPGTARLYEVRGLRNEEEILLRDRCETLQTLSVPLKIQLSRLREKIVIGEVAEAHITHICETAAVVAFQGELEEWEDVRVHLAAAEGEPEPGKIYGKVSAITRNGGASGEAQVRFTSVSPGAYRFICAKGFGT